MPGQTRATWNGSGRIELHTACHEAATIDSMGRFHDFTMKLLLL